MQVQSSVVLTTLMRINIQLLTCFMLTILYFLSASVVGASVSSVATSNFSSQLNSKQQESLNNALQNIKNEQFKQALSISNDLLEETPTSLQAQFIRARALSELGQIEASINAYQSILESEHYLKSKWASPEIYNNLATLYAKQGKLEEARKTLESGIATNEQYKTLYDNLSAIYVEMARGAYSKALKLGVQAKSIELKTLQLATLPSKPTNILVAVAESKPTLKQAVNLPKNKSTEFAAVAKQKSVIVKEKIALQETEVKTKPVVKIAASVNTSPLKRTPINDTQVVKTKINKDEVITALHGWAAAWSAQAVDLYLSFYGKDFKPVNLSKKVWAVQRRIRVSKPRWVNVRLGNFKIRPDSSKQDQAVVQLVQDYRADNYKDKTKKQFVMKKTMDGWRILSEHNLAVLQ